MEPSRHPEATLGDLLDRALDRGLMINADLVICLAGIPLLAVNLRAAIAGMETMLQYGLMTEWDESLRLGREGKPKATPMSPPLPLRQRYLEVKDV